MEEVQYMISFSHGEYDDFTRIPLFIVADKESAYLIREAIENKEQPYLDIAKKAFHDDDFFEQLIREDSFGVDVWELPLVSI